MQVCRGQCCSPANDAHHATISAQYRIVPNTPPNLLMSIVDHYDDVPPLGTIKLQPGDPSSRIRLLAQTSLRKWNTKQ